MVVLIPSFIYLANLISISYEHSLAYAYNKMNSELFIHLFDFQEGEGDEDGEDEGDDGEDEG